MNRHTIGALLFLSAWALAAAVRADTHRGVVADIRVESSPQPSFCAMTAPAAPGAARICLRSSEPHYQAMKDLLLRAFERGWPCAFEWTVVDSITGRARLAALSCSRE